MEIGRGQNRELLQNGYLLYTCRRLGINGLEDNASVRCDEEDVHSLPVLEVDLRINHYFGEAVPGRALSFIIRLGILPYDYYFKRMITDTNFNLTKKKKSETSRHE